MMIKAETSRLIFLGVIRKLGDSGYLENWLQELFKRMHRQYINKPIDSFEGIVSIETAVKRIKEYWEEEYRLGKKISEYNSGYFSTVLGIIWIEESSRHKVKPRIK